MLPDVLLQPATSALPLVWRPQTGEHPGLCDYQTAVQWMETLVARPGRVFSRDQLMTAAWEDPGASFDRTVDAHIKSVRAKLRAVAPDVDPIQTHRGLGYSLRERSPGVPPSAQ